MHTFFCDDFRSNQAYLNGGEQHHARVLRLAVGDDVRIVDGRGGSYVGPVVSMTKHEVVIECSPSGFSTAPSRLWLAVAPPKNITRFEWFVEKATEIGIARITPLLCQRSERRRLKTDRLMKIMTSAMKQSGKAHLPTLDELTPYNDMVHAGESHLKGIATQDEHSISIQDLDVTGRDSMILIGPEGDFSPEEIRMATENGFQKVSLGPYRLRTETAAIYACVTMQLKSSKNA
jgi:16S rRNA (uracil1498-N3)-methyltransferase